MIAEDKAQALVDAVRSDIEQIAERETVMRQAPADLQVAFKQATMMFRQQSEGYRHNRYSPMDKKVRKSMAATLADWARLIEAHSQHLQEQSNDRT